jgi:hypothetical protein
MVMEFIEGKTLADVILEADRLSPEEFFPIATQLCDGLGYAHRKGVIHQDVKSVNIFVEPDKTVKVADFGIARISKDAVTRMSGQMPSGTLEYMSPEVLRGKPPTKQSDLYSLGIVFYEMLTGEPPFVRGDIFRLHQEVMPDRIPGVPDEINEVVFAALAKSAKDRPETLDGYRTIIESAQKGKTAASTAKLKPEKPAVVEKPLPGIIELRSNVDKPQIQVDGKFARYDTAPDGTHRIFVDPGEHTINVFKQGYDSPIRNKIIKVASEETASIDARMTKKEYEPPPKPEPGPEKQAWADREKARQEQQDKEFREALATLGWSIFTGIVIFILVFAIALAIANSDLVEITGSNTVLITATALHFAPLMIFEETIPAIIFLSLAYIFYFLAGRFVERKNCGRVGEAATVFSVSYCILLTGVGLYGVLTSHSGDSLVEMLLGLGVVIVAALIQTLIVSKAGSRAYSRKKGK